jgi:phosphohistidine phosphatase
VEGNAMVQLLLLRHAKSSRDDPNVADFDRPLTKRGERDAVQAGKLLAAQGLIPDLILCSTAKRARETLAGVLPQLSGSLRVDFRDDLYAAGGRDYIGIIAANGDSAQRLMVIGHNPATQETARHLIGSGDPDLIARIEDGFPTAAVAVIDFDFEQWQQLARHSGELTAFLDPRNN